jgi:hypothetical protein
MPLATAMLRSAIPFVLGAFAIEILCLIDENEQN